MRLVGCLCAFWLVGSDNRPTADTTQIAAATVMVIQITPNSRVPKLCMTHGAIRSKNDINTSLFHSSLGFSAPAMTLGTSRELGQVRRAAVTAPCHRTVALARRFRRLAFPPFNDNSAAGQHSSD